MSSADHTIWTRVLSYLREKRPDIHRQWFEELEPLGISNGVYRITSHDAARRNYLDRNCHDAFEEAIRDNTDRLVSVRFVGSAEATWSASAPPVVEETREQYARRHASPYSPDSLEICPDYTFENFIEGPETRLACAAARAVAEQPNEAFNPLFIHGDVGLGKTHLLNAICQQLSSGAPGVRIYYVSCESFTTQFMDAVKAGEMPEFRHRFRDVDMLVIDDIHSLAKLDRSQEEFFHTFNSLYQAGKQIVLSSDAPPHQIPDLESRLVSRFQSGLVVEISAPSYETRIQLVRRKGRIRGLDVSDDVTSFIASVITRNIREIEGAVAKLHLRHVKENRPIDVGLARESIDHVDCSVDPEINVTAIIDAVTQHFDVRLADLQSKRRQKSIAQPRQICMFLARKHTRYSFEEIGGWFGGRDHSTVIHAVKTIDQRCKDDDALDRTIQAIEQRFLNQRPETNGLAAG